MDIVYLFRHSPHRDEELRFSLRSVARHAPWVRKVWVFGDCPPWLSADRQAVEHVDHEAVAWIVGCASPVANTFLMLYLAALLPEVTPGFLHFCDDYVLLDDLSPADAVKPRYLEDLDATTGNRGTGLYKDALWRTYDLLKRLGYQRLNYEVHVPVFFPKKRILAAVRDFQDFITEDRYYGPLALLTIQNHAQKHEGFAPVDLRAEGRYTGFHFRAFSTEEIAAGCAGKRFLNFDDASFDPAMRAFLQARFPEPCRFER